MKPTEKQTINQMSQNRRAAGVASVLTTDAWVTVGDVRLTASEWNLLHSLTTTPALQSASNAELERTRVGSHFSAVATDLEELMNKGLIMVHGSTKEGRTIRLTGLALKSTSDL